MLGIIKLVASPYQSLAPIVSNPAPLALDLTKLGEALKEMWSWGSDQDVYDPEEAHRRHLGGGGSPTTLGASPPLRKALAARDESPALRWGSSSLAGCLALGNVFARCR